MTDLNTAVAQGLVTGLPGFGVVPRQDIDTLLLKEPDSFNLFLLALRELQNEKPGQSPQWREKMSFYQLAGQFSSYLVAKHLYLTPPQVYTGCQINRGIMFVAKQL